MVVEPPVFVPVIVYILVAISSVGVPLISPVAVSNVRPSGSSGLISHVTISPGPVRVGVTGKSELAVLFVNVKLDGVYDIDGT